MSKKPAKAKTPTSTAPKVSTTKIVLFGLDEQERPRGAWFTDQDEALLVRMAKGLGLRMGVATAPRHHAVLSKFPKGDLHATDLKAVPQVPLDLYEKLNALVGGETGVIATAQPKSWDSIEPGHLVIALDTISEGWLPAVVTKRRENNLVLKWRDFPGEGEFIRNANSVALLNRE